MPNSTRIAPLAALAKPLLGLLLAAFAAPLAAEVTKQEEHHFVVVNEVVVKADLKATWLALIQPSTWWNSQHTWSGDAANLSLTPQGGGCFCERIPEVDQPGRFTLEGSVEHMRVIQAYPEQSLRMVGALGPLQSEPVTGVLTIALSEVKTKTGTGTRIVWEYNVGGPMRFEVGVISKAVDGVMGLQLGGLAKLLGPAEVEAKAPADSAAKPAASAAETPAAKPAATAPAVTPAAKPAATPPTAVPAAKPAATPPTATPAAKPAATIVPQPAATPAAKPAATPPAATIAPKPAATTVSKPAATSPAPKVDPKSAPKPAPKRETVDEAFKDLKDDRAL